MFFFWYFFFLFFFFLCIPYTLCWRFSSDLKAVCGRGRCRCLIVHIEGSVNVASERTFLVTVAVVLVCAVRYDYIKQVVRLNIYTVTLLLLIACTHTYSLSLRFLFYFFISFHLSCIRFFRQQPALVEAFESYRARVTFTAFEFRHISFLSISLRLVRSVPGASALEEWLCRTENAELKMNRRERASGMRVAWSHSHMHTLSHTAVQQHQHHQQKRKETFSRVDCVEAVWYTSQAADKRRR